MPRLLDLFCCAGGAGMGYHRAGFEVVGVDIKPQPHYPFEFHQSDALEFLDSYGHEFDVLHASPPCQSFTLMLAAERSDSGRVERHPDFLTPIRARFAKYSVPWVIENVVGAKNHMVATLTLHGGMFGLGVNRPRLFESNVLILAPFARRTPEPIAVYGDHPEDSRGPRPDGHAPTRRARNIEEARHAMQIDWMDWHEIREAIPPAYTEFIGIQLLQAIAEGSQ
jgi:DNA (cytosine-5)-methyltransferase 1